MSQDNYQPMEDAFRDGVIASETSDVLQKHLLALSNQVIRNDAVQHRDIIRGITINHILLQRHIDGLNKQNSKTEKLVIALTVASLIGTGVQVWYAAKADKIPEAKATVITLIPQTQTSIGFTPSLPRATNQPTKKVP